MQNSNAHASRPRSVVVLTGAGISAESGIQTFRASDGLWEEHRIEDVASPEGFARNPTLVYDFYNQRRRQVQAAAITPNAAHSALARFEYDFVQAGGEFLLVTQNVDNLHERAGSQHSAICTANSLRAAVLTAALSSIGSKTSGSTRSAGVASRRGICARILCGSAKCHSA